MSLPPLAWFQDPALTELTPLTVTKDGQVFGHLAGWSIKHRSFPGRNITAPRSPSGYRHFTTGSVEVSDGDDTKVIRAGNLTIGGGHADTSLSANDARRHYDEAGSIVAQVAIGEDTHGIWYSGALMPDVDELTLRRFRACALSGDWRSLDGHALDLVAALAVPTPGFPIARVASSAPLSLVAAGALAPSASFGRVVDPAWVAAVAVTAESITAGEITVESLNAEKAPAAPSPADLADLIAKRLDERREAAELAAAHAALAAEADETPALVASLLAETDDTPGEMASLLADLDDTSDRVGALLAELDEGSGGADPKGAERLSDVSDEDLQALADLAAEEGLTEEAFASRMPPQLQKSYLTGKVAARIAWRTPGDMTRCMAQAKAHGMGRMAPGACARLHKIATGVWPGDRRNL